MTEATRFFRYLAPGLVLLVEVLLYHFASHPEAARSLIGRLMIAGGAGAALTLLVGSGGAGYLLSQVYYLFARILPGDLRLEATRVLNWARERGYLELKCVEADDHAEVAGIAPDASWMLLNIIWHGWREQDAQIRGIETRQQVAADLAHGAGTSFVAAVAAVVLWAAFVFWIEWLPNISCTRWLAVGALFILILALHWLAFAQAMRSYLRMVHASFATALATRGEEASRRTILYCRRDQLEFRTNVRSGR